VSKHTPGPWALEPASMGFGGVYGPDGEIVFALAYARPDERPEAECEANAHLIAAAPEMLEALREALEYFDGKADAEYLPGRAAPVGNREMQLCGEIRAAIAKAEGR